MLWKRTHGLSQHRERVGESQLVRATGKHYKRELGHRLAHGGDKLLNSVSDRLGVPGFSSDDQSLEI